jgi:hypothetical protein
MCKKLLFLICVVLVLGLIDTASSGSCVQPPANMVAWWPLDETVGVTSEDIVGDNDGTWMGSPVPVLGEHVANSLRFNGSSDYVRVPDDDALNFGTSDFSIDAWIRTTSTGTYDVFIDKRNYDPVIGYEFLLYQGKLSLGLGTSSGWTSYYDVSPLSYNLRDGQWHFVAVTVDRNILTGGKLYVDGELIYTFNPIARAGSITNSAELWIGRHHPVSIFPQELWFHGDIDEVELFNRVLDASEIRAIFEAGIDGKCKCEQGETYKDDIKWSQPPVLDSSGCINGWDEVSVIGSGSNGCWDCPTQSHGDADCDGYVGPSDLTILTAAYDTIYGDPNYNPCPDFDRDGDVDINDYQIMMAYWGTYPPGDDPSGRQIVADDWVCMDGRPITDIHWWGSFKGWSGQRPPTAEMPKAFRIGIWTDVPKALTNPFSHPGRLIWENVCNCYTWSYAGCDIDPRGTGVNDTCFKFDQLLSQDEWFYQETSEPNGTVYWLSIVAVYDGNTPAHPWGWTTRPHFYNDDAVRIMDINDGSWPPIIGTSWASGEPIEYPAGTSWDAAFVLTTNRMYEPRRGYWPSSSGNGSVTPISQVDFDGDLIVNFKDFAVFAGYWLNEGMVWPEIDMP